jgi:hypothetical protein
MIKGFSLSNYLLLVDYTGRLFREGRRDLAVDRQKRGPALEIKASKERSGLPDDAPVLCCRAQSLYKTMKISNVTVDIVKHQVNHVDRRAHGGFSPMTKEPEHG